MSVDDYASDLLLLTQLRELKAGLPIMDALSGGYARLVIERIEAHLWGDKPAERPSLAAIQLALADSQVRV